MFWQKMAVKNVLKHYLTLAKIEAVVYAAFALKIAQQIYTKTLLNRCRQHADYLICYTTTNAQPSNALTEVLTEPMA